MHPKKIKMFIGVVLFLFVLISTAWPQNPMKFKTDKKRADVKAEKNLSLPKPLGAENIDHIVAGLSDEQVRRLLINELNAQAQQEAQSTTAGVSSRF